MRTTIRVLAAALTAALILSGCQSTGKNDSGSGSSGGRSQPSRPGPKDNNPNQDPGCRNPGPQTAALLPDFSQSPLPVVSDLNPCLPSTKLVGEMLGKLSSGDRETAGHDFLGKLDTFTKRLDALESVQECAYQTDRLALGVYHHGDYPWSIGAVAVARGGLGAVVDTAKCYLLKMIPGLGFGEGVAPSSGPPQVQPCFQVILAHHDGQAYTIMWIGSSDAMCDAFSSTYLPMVPGDGELVTAGGDPNVAVRQGPDTGAALVAREPYGTIGRAVCSAHGTSVNGNDLWVKTVINGAQGFVAAAYLDAGAASAPACPAT